MSDLNKSTPLRFITAGSVDDGKSTLIGRLLYDSKALLSDQLLSLNKSKNSGEVIDFSILTDGLEAERNKGSPLMLPTVIFLPPSVNLSLPTPRDTNNIPVIW